ncbi:Pycsar system effector family protein [Streptomyces sp. MS19]|uniref:Pycsar system effector family protein n=1 Tax=Streptomyces sp. MS19 TaxID=3385972 RepID=UPI0039A3E32F
MSSLPDRDVNAALDVAYAEAQGQIARTDTKTANLTTFIGLLLTGVTLAGSAMPLPLAARLVGAAGVALLVVAAGVLLWAARPKLRPRAAGTFPHWATLTPEALIADLSADRRAGAVVALSRLAVAKYGQVQRAVTLTLAAGVLLAVAALIAVGGAL